MTAFFARSNRSEASRYRSTDYFPDDLRTPIGRTALNFMNVSKQENLSVAELRTALGWSRAQFAGVVHASDYAIVNWEAGDPVSPAHAAKLCEIQNVYNELNI
jgi:DNA-binding XRE family transcriptional regulator